jgi:hypothetical protein
MRADEIAIEIAKTGKVTAVVPVMSTFCKKNCKTRSANPENKKLWRTRSLLAKRRKVPISWRKIPTDKETFLKKQEKAGNQRN